MVFLTNFRKRRKFSVCRNLSYCVYLTIIVYNVDQFRWFLIYRRECTLRLVSNKVLMMAFKRKFLISHMQHKCANNLYDANGFRWLFWYWKERFYSEVNVVVEFDDQWNSSKVYSKGDSPRCSALCLTVLGSKCSFFSYLFLLITFKISKKRKIKVYNTVSHCAIFKNRMFDAYY